MNTRILMSLSFVAAVVIGCESENKPKLSVNDHFEADTAPRSVQGLFAQQQANGARQDGTLYAHHFTGNELNSLGRQKLELMTSGAERGPVAIYLDLAKDNTYGARESAVVAFVSSKGLASDAYSITPGANPNLGTPAVQGLNGLSKQQDAGASGASGSAAPAGMSGTK